MAGECSKSPAHAAAPPLTGVVPCAQEEGQQQPAPNGGRPRTQQDINADQWLDRIQNDPGSFLKNQFMIEDRDSGQQ